jgi:hypothetical protein
MINSIKNKGTGAGGANTTLNGSSFEVKIDNEQRLIKKGFVQKLFKNGTTNYLEKDEESRIIHFVKQRGLRYYMKELYEKDIYRNPDEAYIFTDKNTGIIEVKILEKKNQNKDGSVEDKLCLGHHFKFTEYPFYLGEKFKVDYAFAISDFLKNKYNSDHPKWKLIKYTNDKNEIPVFFGDEESYYTKLDAWLNL